MANNAGVQLSILLSRRNCELREHTTRVYREYKSHNVLQWKSHLALQWDPTLACFWYVQDALFFLHHLGRLFSDFFSNWTLDHLFCLLHIPDIKAQSYLNMKFHAMTWDSHDGLCIQEITSLIPEFPPAPLPQPCPPEAWVQPLVQAGSELFLFFIFSSVSPHVFRLFRVCPVSVCRAYSKVVVHVHVSISEGT